MVPAQQMSLSTYQVKKQKCKKELLSGMSVLEVLIKLSFMHLQLSDQSSNQLIWQLISYTI